MPSRVLVLAGIILALFYTFLVSFYPTIHELDIQFVILLLTYRNDILNAFSVFFNEFGSQILWLAVAIVFFISSRKLWALTFLAGLVLDAVVVNGLKLVVERPRPKDVIEGLNVIEAGEWPSFPSGHASRSFMGSVLLGSFYPSLRLFWYTVAGLSSFSRIYLGAHFPTDVVAGALNGVLLGYAAIALTRTGTFQRLVGIRARRPCFVSD